MLASTCSHLASFWGTNYPNGHTWVIGSSTWSLKTQTLGLQSYLRFEGGTGVGARSVHLRSSRTGKQFQKLDRGPEVRQDTELGAK